MVRRLTLIFGLLLVTAAAAFAQTPGEQRPSSPPVPGRPDFLFGEPRGSLGVRGSWVFARAGSDLFDFVQQHLTVDKSDFNGPAFGLDAGVALTPRIDVLFDFEMTRARTSSEYRAYTDNNRLPINQETTLSSRGLAGSVRINLVPRGRAVSRYAWVPRGLTPFVGGGGGALWYRFEQSGDFVDFIDLDVFTDYFRSSGWTPSVHLFGGTDVHLYRGLFATIEGRYVWAHATLGNDFVDFDPIDLAGFRVSSGINFVF